MDESIQLSDKQNREQLCTHSFGCATLNQDILGQKDADQFSFAVCFHPQQPGRKGFTRKLWLSGGLNSLRACAHLCSTLTSTASNWNENVWRVWVELLPAWHDALRL
jgi:hypothetical protein